MRTLTGTYTAEDGVTRKYTALVPDAGVFVHSRHIPCSITITDTNNVAVVNRRIQLIGMSTTGALNELRYTDGNGVITYDIARMLQITKGDIKEELDIDQNTNSQLSKTRKLNIQFYDGGVQMAVFWVEMLTGANDTVDNWWIGKRVLRWFTNYPFTFDFQNFNGNWSVGQIGAALASEAFPYVTTTLVYALARINPLRKWGLPQSRTTGMRFSSAGRMATSDGDITSSTNVLDLIYDNQTFDLDKKCYLRWIGKHGEVFYWLFRKFATVEATARETIRRTYVSDRYNEYGVIDTEEPADFTKARTLAVFTDMLNNDEFEVVKSIIDSPYIDMLVSYTVETTPRNEQQSEGGEGSGSDDERDNGDDTDAGYINEVVKWQRVTVDSGSYQTKRKADKSFTDKQVIVTLVLPEEGGLSL